MELSWLLLSRMWRACQFTLRTGTNAGSLLIDPSRALYAGSNSQLRPLPKTFDAQHNTRETVVPDRHVQGRAVSEWIQLGPSGLVSMYSRGSLVLRTTLHVSYRSSTRAHGTRASTSGLLVSARTKAAPSWPLQCLLADVPHLPRSTGLPRFWRSVPPLHAPGCAAPRTLACCRSRSRQQTA